MRAFPPEKFATLINMSCVHYRKAAPQSTHKTTAMWEARGGRHRFLRFVLMHSYSMVDALYHALGFSGRDRLRSGEGQDAAVIDEQLSGSAKRSGQNHAAGWR
jgi:hypothetical protein